MPKLASLAAGCLLASALSGCFLYKQPAPTVQGAHTNAAPAPAGPAGWYLLFPPLSSNGQSINPDAPLSQWHALGSYDSASQCMIGLTAVRNSANRTNYDTSITPGGVPALSYTDFLSRVLHSQCIATDDPRLKGK